MKVSAAMMKIKKILYAFFPAFVFILYAMASMLWHHLLLARLATILLPMNTGI